MITIETTAEFFSDLEQHIAKTSEQMRYIEIAPSRHGLVVGRFLFVPQI